MSTPASSGSASVSLPGSESFTFVAPIIDLPARGGVSVVLPLFYNSAVWTVDPYNGVASFNADRDFPGYGFRLGYGMLEGPYTNSVNTTSYTLTEPDGSKHELRILSGTTTYESLDSTYIDLNSSTMTLAKKDGTQWKFQQTSQATFFVPIQIKDTNGNYLTITYNTAPGYNVQAINTITDSLNRTITFNYDPTTHLPTSITVPAFGGTGTKTLATFIWSKATFNYNYPAGFVIDTVASGTQINVLTQCRYANGTGYNFLYGDWGVVNEIDQVSANGILRSYQKYNFPTAATQLTDAPTYTQKTVFDGVNTANWTYQVTKSSFLITAYAVTDPAGTTTTTNLATTGLVSSVVVQSGITTLRTTGYNWTTDTNGNNPRLASTTTTLNDTNVQSQVSFSYDNYGNVTQIQEFDWGLVPARTTQIDYLASTPYLTQHILNHPSQTRVYDASGALISRTDFAYDGTSLASVTGASQHDDAAYSSTFTTRGNLTSITRYQNAAAASGPITRSFSYDTLGNLLAAQVDCCNLEQLSFSLATQYAFPDTVTRGPSVGPQLTTSRTYDLNTGLLTTATDENLQKTSIGYDSMNRPTSVTRPDGALITTSYDDTSAQPSVTTTTPIETGKSLVRVNLGDGLGRTTRQTTKDVGGTAYSILEAQYDALGRVWQVSNPHGATETPVWTVNSYEALGRIATVTPPGSTSNYQYNYSGNATLITDPAGKQRRTLTDAFGRLAQAHEPGYSDGTPGTGSVTISGSEQSFTDPNSCEYIGGKPVFCTTIYDFGTVSVGVGGFFASVTYGKGSTPSTIAAALANSFNTNTSSPVTATYSNATVSLIAKQSGAHTNYTLGASSSTSDPVDFLTASFTATTSGATLTGGTDGSGANGSQPSINTPIATVYSYDPLDNLTLVIQGQQSRTYVYDSLSRLKSATTPESATVNYTYNDSGTVATRTDARGVVTNYGYDGLNRLKQLSYTTAGTTAAPTPSVTYTYGTNPAAYNNGRLSAMTDGIGGESYGYDQLGRLISLTKSIGTTSYPLAYSYNLASELTSITYPSGRAVGQSFDAIGRLGQITSSGVNYLTVPSSNGYNAAGQLLSAAYGNGVAATFTYNAQLQLASLSYANNTSTLFSTSYWYAMDPSKCPNAPAGNNGQVQCITDNVDNGRTLNYTYDAWSRLKTTATAGSAAYPGWGLSWSYDRYGNRIQQTVTAGSNMPSNSVTPSPTTNRLTDIGYAYDLAGNMTNDGSNTLTYDGENRVTASTNGGSSGANAFDGNSLRVQKTVSGATTVYIFSGTKVIAEYASGTAASSPAKEYIYSGSALLATLTGSTTNYHMGDHLSPRLTTDSTGAVVGQQAHFPFGEDWYASGTTTKFKFTSYERDNEAGNDYAMLRSSVNRLGRFSSPDPLAGSIYDPQSLNRYAYVLSDPIDFTDPFGSFLCGSIWISCDPPVSQNNSGGVGGGGGIIIHPNPDGKGEHGGGRSDAIGRDGGDSRVQCAIQFGRNHSLAAAVGAIFGDKVGNNFVTQLLLGNTASSLAKIGTDIFGSTSPDARQVASMALKGVGQGIPNLPGGIPVTGPVAPIRNAAVGAAISAGYNAVTGAGQQTLQLGISSEVATSAAAPLTQTTVQSIVGYATLAKLGIDASTFLYGYFVACKPKK